MTRRALRAAPPVRRPRTSPEGRPFPTEAQLDLLKAAVLPAEQAAPAWRRWKSRGIPLVEVDDASGRLFSQLWLNRSAAAIGDEDLPLIKGVYRQALASNAVTLNSAFQTTQPLTDAGIPVVFIKGAAMIAASGGRLGLRRIVDVDVIVPEADAEWAATALMAAGYREKRIAEPPPFGLRHAWTCMAPNGSELDLHWWAYKTAGDDRCVFETARPATLLARTVLIPSTTEMLAMTVAGAFLGAHPDSPLRWIADAMVLLAVEEDHIEWDVLLQRAWRPGLTLGLLAGLEFLAREFDAPIPPYVLADLRRRPVTLRERGAHWAACHDPRVGLMMLHHLEMHRTRRLHNPAGVPRDFLGHLAQSTGARTGKRRDVFERHAALVLQRIIKREPLLR